MTALLTALLAISGSVFVFMLTRRKDRQLARAQFAMEAFTTFMLAMSEARTQEGYLNWRRDEQHAPEDDPGVLRAGQLYFDALNKHNGARGQLAVVLRGDIVAVLAGIQARDGGFALANTHVQTDLVKVARHLRRDIGARDDDLTDDQIRLLMFSDAAPLFGTPSGSG